MTSVVAGDRRSAAPEPFVISNALYVMPHCTFTNAPEMGAPVSASVTWTRIVAFRGRTDTLTQETCPLVVLVMTNPPA